MDIHNENARMGQQNINSKVYYQYGQRKIKKFLTAPFFPDTFLGREEELQNVHQKLFTQNNLLLLVNGMGGMGKTSVAAEYYLRHQADYQHLAWLYVQSNIADALLVLKDPLQLVFPEKASIQEQLKMLLDELRQLQQPCLLVIDNANELDDLEANYTALRSCPNLHVLITTRITAFANATICPVGALPYPLALQLFAEHYTGHQPADDALFEQVYNAVEGNTLIIELLAKNLQVLQDTHAGYGLPQLVADLQRGVLQITQTKAVESTYHADKLFKGDPLDIIAAMYDIGELPPAEKRLLGILSVLPAESIPFATLQALLPATEGLGDTLHALGRKGWVAHDRQMAAYKTSPVVQEIVRQKNEGLPEDCGELIERLTDKLDYDPGTGHFLNCSYQEALVFARYSEAVTGVLEQADENTDRLLEYLGSYHQTTGNLPKALSLYETSKKMSQQLYDAYPDNVNFKYGLAIACSKLGETHAALGNLPEALRFYQDYNRIIEELYNAYPDNVNFKNGLAISYEKLGETHAALGNLPEALRFYELDADLSKQLFDAYPDNVNFKNGLAIAYQFQGKTHAGLGNLPEALRFYQDYNKLMEELYNAYPDNVNFKNGLAVSFYKLGTAHGANGYRAQQKQYFQQAQQLWQQLAADFPDYAEFGRNLGIINDLLAQG